LGDPAKHTRKLYNTTVALMDSQMNSETDIGRGLTPKQTMFVREYIKDLNGSQSAIRAGFSEKSSRVTAAKLLTKTNIKAAVQAAMDRRSARLELDANWVLENLRNIHDRCKEPRPILDRQGNPTGRFRFDSAGALRALELIGKHLRMFTDRIEVSDFDPAQIVNEAAERVRIARKQAAREQAAKEQAEKVH